MQKRSRMHTIIKDPVVHVKSFVDYGNTQITQQSLKSVSLQNDEDGHYTAEEEEERRALYTLAFAISKTQHLSFVFVYTVHTQTCMHSLSCRVS